MPVCTLRATSPLFIFLSAVSLLGQSLDDYWDDRFDLPGVHGTILSSVLDPDGNLYVRGNLTGASGLPGKRKLLQWDGRRWKSPGITNDTLIVEGKKLRIESDEPLFILGKTLYTIADNFTPSQNPTVHVDYLVSWNGVEWDIVGDGFHGGLSNMAAFESDVYVAGGFHAVGTDSIRNLARWDGSRWNEVGGGTDGSISSMAIDRNGTIYIAGSFSRAGNLEITKEGRDGTAPHGANSAKKTASVRWI